MSTDEMGAEIQIIRLPVDARSVFAHRPESAMTIRDFRRNLYVPFTLVPRMAAEAEALRTWITTHQSMFLLIGAAASALELGQACAATLDFTKAAAYLKIAEGLRLASAVYTYLPTLNQAVYEGYLRPAMSGVRNGFSGVSSRESIAFSILIKQLREKSHQTGEAVYLAAKAAVLESDQRWWQLHGLAMRRMVETPISLAQHEYKRVSGDHAFSYLEFLTTTLQIPAALDDYDRFFACERQPITAEEYFAELDDCLRISDRYISQEQPYASYRAGLTNLIFELKRLVAADEGK